MIGLQEASSSSSSSKRSSSIGRQEHPPVDLLLPAQALEPVEASPGLAQPREPGRGAADIGQVHPAPVVLVVARIGGVHRVVAEEVGEEGVLRLGKAHAHMVPPM